MKAANRMKVVKLARILTLPTFLLVACSPDRGPTGPLPSMEVVERIEARLAQDSCIGSLSNWERVYAFPVQQGQADERYVIAELSQAGLHGRRARRILLPPGGSDLLDHRPMRLASATYDRATGLLHLDYCGPNIPD